MRGEREGEREGTIPMRNASVATESTVHFVGVNESSENNRRGRMSKAGGARARGYMRATRKTILKYQIPRPNNNTKTKICYAMLGKV